MKIAVGSDMKTHLTDVLVALLKESGHEVETFGALVSTPVMWSKVGLEVAEQVAAGNFDQAVLCCWTGTGISMAANKVPGIRAALCIDPGTDEGARKWNDANILAMSLRLVSEPLLKEIVDAWFATQPSVDEEDVACIRYLADRDQ